MKKHVLASVAAIGMLGLAACSDATDETTTQAVPPTEEQPAQPGATTDSTAPATDGTTTPVQPAPAQ
jgi:predicted outer membrane protein